MDILWQILSYTIPSLFVLIVAYFTLKMVFQNEEKDVDTNFLKQTYL